MNHESQEFFEKLDKFSKASIQWCVSESEKSVKMIGEVISFLLADTERISTMSKETLGALNELKQGISKFADNHVEPQALVKIKALLINVQKNHDEAKTFMEPIVTALQFHDRIYQRMENALKVISYWKKNHATYATKKALTSEELLSIGQELAKNTTMIIERDIIRKHIPDLKEEQKPQDDVMFF